MKHLAVRAIFLTWLGLAAAGCNLQMTAGDINPTVKALAQTALLQTLAAATQEAGLGIKDAPPAETIALPPTNTLTPTVTPTATSNKVFVTVSQNTNCRTGPDKIFDLVGIMMVGETAEAVGRNEQKTYWVIKLPKNTAKQCWLWYEWATVSGNGDALPIIQSPPTPTFSPKPDFSYDFLGPVCTSNAAIRIQITNTGNVAWASYRIYVRDTVNDDWRDTQLNRFVDVSPSCTEKPGAQETLAPGATGYAWGFTPHISGHLMAVEVSVYTGDNGGGTRKTGDFTFTMP